MGFVWFIDSIITNIVNGLDKLGYTDSNELVSLVYILLLLSVCALTIIIFDIIICKIKS